MSKSTKEVLRRLEYVPAMIDKLECGYKKVNIDNRYWIVVKSKEFVFYDETKNFAVISKIPILQKHQSVRAKYVPDNPYIDVIAKYLSLP